jgi:ribulose-5-phosphate 4-epimerase/fuculose-1-phosphate aldolase
MERAALRDSNVGVLLNSLTPREQLVALARVLHREGYDDHTTGHITYRQDDDTFLVNPLELTWAELTCSDVMVMDRDGNALEGRHTVTPAITLHTEMHRARPETRVALHGHPRYATVWACAHRVPPIYDQTSAIAGSDVAMYSEYDGTVEDVANARGAVEALGNHDLALLANHGVFVVADSILQAYFWASTLEWRARRAWEVEQIGGGVPLRDEVVAQLHAFVRSNIHRLPQFEAAIRAEMRADPLMFN